MSWFDTSGLASLAKTALKEAQKQIDKALDIQDEEIIETQHPDLISSSSSVKSSGKTLGKTTQLLPTLATNEWDSFSDGTFFDNSKSNEMITTPPKSVQTSPISSDDQFTDLTKNCNKRESIQSNSDSVDLLSTPCSGLTSPSVDVITPTSVISPEVSPSSPNSVEIISPEEILLEDDDDSMSYNTVMDDNIVLVPESKLIEDNIKQCNFTDSTDSGQTLILSTKMQKSTSKSIISLNDSMSESQTVESFENVQMPVDEKSTTQTQLVKISNTSGNMASESSGQLSDPPSADEIETTTSSDIEIISNPNGDSSSSNSRISPGKLKDLGKYMGGNSGSSVKQNTSKPKGHYRDNSEISIQSESENSQSEIEKLMKRISELNEVLEQRELRLLEVSRQNCSLTEKNTELQKLLDAKYCNESEENTQRLSALEKKFQSTLRERDALREQLNNIRSEFAAKIPKDDLTKIITEKDNMIDELRIEGEKLSKQILQHSNIIKKLRAKEKESDTTLKRNKEQIESLTEEVERLKKSLTAKDEVERSQIDAVHKLSSAKRKMEKENQSFKSQIEDLMSKLETLQTSFDAAKKELQEKERNHLELSKKANAFATLETEKNNTQLQNIEIISQLDELRGKLKLAENGSSQRENSLRQENNELLRRLQEAEIRSEELTNDVTMATLPLVRQLEDLRNTLITRTNLWEKQEEEFVQKLKETQSNFEKMKNIETQSRDQQNLLKSKIKNLEDRLQSSLIKCEETNSSLQTNQFEFNMKEADYKSKLSDLENKLEIYHKSADDLNEKCKLLEEKLEAEQKHYKSILEETATIKPDSSITERGESVHNRHSPTLSLGRNSMSESINSSAWQMDDLDMISNPDRRAVDSALNSNNTSFIMTNSQMGHSTAVLENLQSSLKQRDGEISQLQWELTRVTTERNLLNTEVANLTLELENIKEKVSNFETIEKDLSDLKHQYDALLQMYGEKVEETQELELDLQDVKEMYKAQIDELLKQQKQFLLSK